MKTRAAAKTSIQGQIDRMIASAAKNPRTHSDELARYHAELGILYGRIAMLDNGQFDEFAEATGTEIIVEV